MNTPEFKRDNTNSTDGSYAEQAIEYARASMGDVHPDVAKLMAGRLAHYAGILDDSQSLSPEDKAKIDALVDEHKDVS